MPAHGCYMSSDTCVLVLSLRQVSVIYELLVLPLRRVIVRLWVSSLRSHAGHSSHNRLRLWLLLWLLLVSRHLRLRLSYIAPLRSGIRHSAHVLLILLLIDRRLRLSRHRLICRLHRLERLYMHRHLEDFEDIDGYDQ